MKSAGEIIAARRIKQDNQATRQEILKSLRSARENSPAPIPVASPASTRDTALVFERFSAELNQLIQAIRQMPVRQAEPIIHLPDITIPEIKIPEANVKVEIPPITIDYANFPPMNPPTPQPIALPSSSPERIEVNYVYSPSGQLASVTERFADGTFKRARGFDTNRVQFERG